MKNLYDYHIHSTVSFDGGLSIAEICREYAAMGLKGLTFTEHIERREPIGRDISFDKNEYFEEIREARNAFPQLEIGMGIELGLQVYAKNDVITESEGPWDFILGSIHRIDNYPSDRGYIMSGKSKKDYIKDYFTALYEALTEMPCFDVMGHIDLFFRDEDILDKSIAYNDYQEELDRLLRSLIDKGIGIEVNTGGWRYGMKNPHPDISLLKRYRELGGEIVTVGSDCHNRRALAYRLADGYDYLKEAGFKYFSTFKNRKLRQMPIE